jgi:hypothetical protein
MHMIRPLLTCLIPALALSGCDLAASLVQAGFWLAVALLAAPGQNLSALPRRRLPCNSHFYG